MSTKKYTKFLSNFFKKRNKKFVTNIKSEKIIYNVIYSNNYIDLMHNYQVYILHNKDIPTTPIYDLIEHGNAKDVNKIINSIFQSYNKSSDAIELLARLSNIIIEVEMDENNNWVRLLDFVHKIRTGVDVSMHSDENKFYISLNLLALSKMLSIESQDTEIVDFVKDMVQSYGDIRIVKHGQCKECYSNSGDNIFNLGFDVNIPISQSSISDIFEADNKFVLLGIDNSEILELNKIYYTYLSNYNKDIYCINYTVFFERMLSKEFMNDKLYNYLLEIYHSYYININDKSKQISYNNIDEIID